MAQLLIKALEPWNNDNPQAPPERSRLGDIIVVRPDDHVWGREECLPRFIVVQLPGISYDDAKHLEENLQRPFLRQQRIERKQFEASRVPGKTIASDVEYTTYGEFVNNLPTILSTSIEQQKVRVERAVWDDAPKKQGWLDGNFYTVKDGTPVTVVTIQTKDGLKFLYEVEVDIEMLFVEGQKLEMAKVRRWQVPSAYMTKVINLGNSIITITPTAQRRAFINNLIEKTS